MPKPLEFNQDIILENIVKVLRKVKSEEALVKEFDKGHCSGFSLLYLYCKRKSTLPRTIQDGKPIARDDFEWFKATRRKIVTLNHRARLRGKKRWEMFRFISLVRFFQITKDYAPIGQGEMHRIVEDTSPDKIIREYSLGAVFLLDDLIRTLGQIVHENRMILLTSHNHDMALIKIGNDYCFFDPNDDDEEEVITTSAETVAKAIFAAFKFEHAQYCPIGFRIFHLPQKNEPAVSYPSQESIIDNLAFVRNHKINISHSKYNDSSAMNIAAWINCNQSLKAILRHRPKINIRDKFGYTPLHEAASQGACEASKVLIKAGANTTLKTNAGETAHQIAKLFKFEDFRETLKKTQINHKRKLRKKAEKQRRQPSICTRVNTTLLNAGKYVYSQLPGRNIFGFFSGCRQQTVVENSPATTQTRNMSNS